MYFPVTNEINWSWTVVAARREICCMICYHFFCTASSTKDSGWHDFGHDLAISGKEGQKGNLTVCEGHTISSTLASCHQTKSSWNYIFTNHDRGFGSWQPHWHWHLISCLTSYFIATKDNHTQKHYNTRTQKQDSVVTVFLPLGHERHETDRYVFMTSNMIHRYLLFEPLQQICAHDKGTGMVQMTPCLRTHCVQRIGWKRWGKTKQQNRPLTHFVRHFKSKHKSCAGIFSHHYHHSNQKNILFFNTFFFYPELDVEKVLSLVKQPEK